MHIPLSVYAGRLVLTMAPVLAAQDGASGEHSTVSSGETGVVSNPPAVPEKPPSTDPPEDEVEPPPVEPPPVEPPPLETVLYQGLEWQKGDEGVRYTWDEAGTHCEDLVLAGHDDWRLPSWEELKSLVVCQDAPDTDHPAETAYPETPLADYPGHPYYCGDPEYWGQGNVPDYAIPTIDSAFTSYAWYYWSADVANASEAWALHFGVGGAKKGVVRTAAVHVRCVRSPGETKVSPVSSDAPGAPKPRPE